MTDKDKKDLISSIEYNLEIGSDVILSTKDAKVIVDILKNKSAWNEIYTKVLALETEYEKAKDIEKINRCLKLENLLMYFKEKLLVENKGKYAVHFSGVAYVDADCIGTAEDLFCNEKITRREVAIDRVEEQNNDLGA